MNCFGQVELCCAKFSQAVFTMFVFIQHLANIMITQLSKWFGFDEVWNSQNKAVQHWFYKSCWYLPSDGPIRVIQIRICCLILCASHQKLHLCLCSCAPSQGVGVVHKQFSQLDSTGYFGQSLPVSILDCAPYGDPSKENPRCCWSQVKFLPRWPQGRC